MGSLLYSFSSSNKEFIPKQLLLTYEQTIDYIIKYFFNTLFVKTGLAGSEILDFKVRLHPVDMDECSILPESVASVLNHCSDVCGQYDFEKGEMNIFLGCLGRGSVRRLRFLEIPLDEYTVFHLIIHHLQAKAPGLTMFQAGNPYTSGNEVMLQFLEYSREVEADYLARILLCLSEEGKLGIDHHNRHLKHLWKPLRNVVTQIPDPCEEKIFSKAETPAGPIYLDGICHNPFGWLSSRIMRVLDRLGDIVNVSTKNAGFTAELVNLMGIGADISLEGIYLGGEHVCLIAEDEKLLACYNGSRLRVLSRIVGAGFKLVFTEPVDIDLKRLNRMTVKYNAPGARVVFNVDGYSVAAEASLVYIGEEYMPEKKYSSIDELQQLLSRVKGQAQLPPGLCDQSRRYYVIPLPKIEWSSSDRRTLTLQLSEFKIPVSGRLCNEIDDIR